MKAKIIIGIISFFIGCILGWLFSFYHDYNDFGKTLRLIKEGELAVAICQGDEPYFLKRWDIAEWELKKINDKLNDYLQNHYSDEKFLKYELFVANARLARVYDALGDKEASEKQALLAIKLMEDAKFNPRPVTNSVTLFNVLDRIDSIRNKVSKGGNH
jgi:hypothetical protein